MEPLYFVHLSDTHLDRDGKEPYLKDTAGSLRRVADALQDLPVKPAFVLITGDLAHEGDEEDYRFVKSEFTAIEEKLGVPVLVTLGNHDNRTAFYRGYLASDAERSYRRSVVVDGLRVILLDSKTGEHDVSGGIDREQLDWLAAELRTGAEKGTVVALHHPPEDTVLPMGELCLENSDALAALLKNSDVIGILSGHTHFPNQSLYGGSVLNSTAGSTAFGLRMTSDEVRLVETSSFSLCAVRGRKLSVSSFQCANPKVLCRFMQKDFDTLSKEYNPDNLKVR